jgi:hypothetical protein
VNAIPPKGTPERSQYYRELVARRWAKPRPAPRQDRRGARTLLAGSEEEAFWEARANELGLTDEGMSRTSYRRLLLRLVDADTARLSQGNDADDLLLTFLEREAQRLRERAVRDRSLADAHDREAAAAEGRLAAEHRRLGLS